MKYLLTSIIVFVALLNSQAQHKMAFGPSVGLGISAIQYNHSIYNGLGYKMGISSKLKLNNTFFLCPELYLSYKGFTKFDVHLTALHPTPENDYSLSLHYLDICLPVKIKIRNTFYFQTGIQAGYLLDASYASYSDVTDYLEKWDYGLLAGMNWDMPNGLGFSLVANAGIVDINSKKLEAPVNDPYYYYETDHLDFGKNILLTGGIHYLFGKTKGKIVF